MWFLEPHPFSLVPPVNMVTVLSKDMVIIEDGRL